MKSVLTIATAGALAVTLAACAGSGGAQGGQNFVDGKTFTMVLGTDRATSTRTSPRSR